MAVGGRRRGQHWPVPPQASAEPPAPTSFARAHFCTFVFRAGWMVPCGSHAGHGGVVQGLVRAVRQRVRTRTPHRQGRPPRPPHRHPSPGAEREGSLLVCPDPSCFPSALYHSDFQTHPDGARSPTVTSSLPGSPGPARLLRGSVLKQISGVFCCCLYVDRRCPPGTLVPRSGGRPLKILHLLPVAWPPLWGLSSGPCLSRNLVCCEKTRVCPEVARLVL